MPSHTDTAGHTKARVAKGRKLSGNFGNFPWKVSEIFNGSGILGIKWSTA